MFNFESQLTDEEARCFHAQQYYKAIQAVPEGAYDDLTQLARMLCQTPMSILRVVGGEQRTVLSSQGL